jgi:hypothetical protein
MTTKTTASVPPQIPGLITLNTPIQRGDTHIEAITLRKPNAGELRGIKLADLLQMDVGTLITLTPRISVPTLTEPEAALLGTEDLLAIGTEIVGFFVPKSKPQTVES